MALSMVVSTVTVKKIVFDCKETKERTHIMERTSALIILTKFARAY